MYNVHCALWTNSAPPLIKQSYQKTSEIMLAPFPSGGTIKDDFLLSPPRYSQLPMQREMAWSGQCGCVATVTWLLR